MAKWADYLISGVWFHKTVNSKYVSHVMLHQDRGDTMDLGEKQSKDYVIQLLKKGYTILTIRWNYQTAKWLPGARVDFETLGRIDYLRTDPDASVTDNLDNLIDMGFFQFI